MPIDYRYEPKYSVILVKAFGVLTLKDILDHLAVVASDARVSADHVTLFDTSDISEMRLSSSDIAEISSFTRDHPSDKLIARKLAIITRGSRETNLAEEYERFAATFKENTIVFYNRDVACKWLGIPENL